MVEGEVVIGNRRGHGPDPLHFMHDHVHVVDRNIRRRMDENGNYM